MQIIARGRSVERTAAAELRPPRYRLRIAKSATIKVRQLSGRNSPPSDAIPRRSASSSVDRADATRTEILHQVSIVAPGAVIGLTHDWQSIPWPRQACSIATQGCAHHRFTQRKNARPSSGQAAAERAARLSRFFDCIEARHGGARCGSMITSRSVLPIRSMSFAAHAAMKPPRSLAAPATAPSVTLGQTTARLSGVDLQVRVHQYGADALRNRQRDNISAAELAGTESGRQAGSAPRCPRANLRWRIARPRAQRQKLVNAGRVRAAR